VSARLGYDVKVTPHVLRHYLPSRTMSSKR
jgi:hypothetical protein